MRIENTAYQLTRRSGASWLEAVGELFAAETSREGSVYPLRFSISSAAGDTATVEATLIRYSPNEPYADSLRQIELIEPRRKTHSGDPFTVVQVIPTGIRCEFGGFAGDACPATNLLAAAADLVVTHPNAVNASELNEMAPNVLYVEGKSLDDFLLGYTGLRRVRANRIGTFVDPAGEKYLEMITNTLDAARTAAGIDCGSYALLAAEVGAEMAWSSSGCAVGRVAEPSLILDGVRQLLDSGHDAVGGVSVIHGVSQEVFARHQNGEIPNPSGGVEAIITHLVSKIFRVPTAHAPLPYYQDLKADCTPNPRSAAEFISTPHYFSVLKGLHRAPGLVGIDSLDRAAPDLLTLNHVAAVVMPASALGGLPALAADFSRIPLIAVEENETVLRVDRASLGLSNVISASSYLEAAGLLLAMKNGIALESLRRPVRPAQGL